MMVKTYPISSFGRLRMATDGDGIRTLIVVSGCPLRCKYCINPFTWDGTRKAEMLTASQVQDRIRMDRLYMLATGGGITFGGGEPLLYPDLIKELRDLCEPELTICVETSLNVEYSNIDQVAELVDWFYVDIKTMDANIYHAYTGGELGVVIDNLEKLLAKKREKIWVRIPVIPGFTDKESQLQSREKLRKLGVQYFDLFEYRLP